MGTSYNIIVSSISKITLTSDDLQRPQNAKIATPAASIRPAKLVARFAAPLGCSPTTGEGDAGVVAAGTVAIDVCVTSGTVSCLEVGVTL